MKIRTFVSILILVLAVLIIMGSCATDKMTYISKEYEIYGTWVNPKYNYEDKHHAKFVVHPNGKMEIYSTDASNTSYDSAELVITNK
jgi:hypothetical protein